MRALVIDLDNGWLPIWCQPIIHTVMGTGCRFKIKTPSYQYSHYKNETIVKASYPYNSRTRKMTSLYWIAHRALLSKLSSHDDCLIVVGGWRRLWQWQKAPFSGWHLVAYSIKEWPDLTRIFLITHEVRLNRPLIASFYFKFFKPWWNMNF